MAARKDRRGADKAAIARARKAVRRIQLMIVNHVANETARRCIEIALRNINEGLSVTNAQSYRAERRRSTIERRARSMIQSKRD